MRDDDSGDLPPAEIMAALAGEPAAFRRFYDHYDPDVRWAVGLYVSRWPELVPLREDIVQEVWNRLLNDRGKMLRYYDESRGLRFGRFLVFVAARLGWRVGKRQLLPPGSQRVELPEESDLGALEVKLLRRDLLAQLVERAKLSDHDVELLAGHYFRGETIRRIAKRLGINENTASQRHGRLLERLRRLAEELLDERHGDGMELVAVLFMTALLLGENGPVESSPEDVVVRSEVEVTRG